MFKAIFQVQLVYLRDRTADNVTAANAYDLKGHVLGTDDMGFPGDWDFAGIYTHKRASGRSVSSGGPNEVRKLSGNVQAVDLMVGGNNKEIFVKPMKKKDTNKRDFNGYGETVSGGIKVLANSRKSADWNDVTAWFMNNYGDPEPPWMLWKTGLYEGTWALAGDAQCGDNVQMIAVMEDNTGFGHDWEVGQDWCFGGCKTNCQFSNGEEMDCQGIQSGDEAVVITGSSLVIVHHG